MRVLLVDRCTMIRQGLRSLLECAGLTIAGEPRDGRAAVAMAKQLRPDIVLIESALPLLNGVDAAERIIVASKRAHKTHVIALTDRADRHHVLQMIDAGVSGYVLKEDSFEDLIKAIETVMAGQPYYSDELAPLIDAYLNGDEDEQMAARRSLGSREREVLQLLAEGRTTRQVAADLDLSTKTIEIYRSRIMKRLGVSGMAELTRFAAREGIIIL